MEPVWRSVGSSRWILIPTPPLTGVLRKGVFFLREHNVPTHHHPETGPRLREREREMEDLTIKPSTRNERRKFYR